MKLSIIIVHHKTPELLKLCLKSLKDFVLSEIQHEIIVVDSESTRESRDIIYENFQDVKLIAYNENTGYAKGVNSGISASCGKYLLILNPDIIITKNSVPNMLNFMETRPEVGILGPQLLNFDGSIQRSCFRFYSPLTILSRRTFMGKMPFLKKIHENFLMLDADLDKIQHPDWIMGSAMMVSRRGIENVGLMDERFFLYFEDVDWARRFWENGYAAVYFPEAKFFHYHQRKSRAGFDIFDLLIRKETRLHIKSAIAYFLKHGVRSCNNKYKHGKIQTVRL